MDRLTYKTNGKYMNTVAEQAPPYAIDCDIDTAVTKLAEYEDLEEQGKLLKLPCKAGQRVYLLRKDIKRIIDGEITSITISEFASGMRIFIVDDNRYTDASFDKIGEIVFFTQEAAEAALKEMSE